MSFCGAWATVFFVPVRKFLSIITLMLLVLFLSGCEKIDVNDQIMQSFYASSCQLNENSNPEEVQHLGQEFETTTNRNEELKQHKLYNPTHQNLETAGYEFEVGIHITIETDWDSIEVNKGQFDMIPGEK